MRTSHHNNWTYLQEGKKSWERRKPELKTSLGIVHWLIMQLQGKRLPCNPQLFPLRKILRQAESGRLDQQGLARRWKFPIIPAFWTIVFWVAKLSWNWESDLSDRGRSTFPNKTHFYTFLPHLNQFFLAYHFLTNLSRHAKSVWFCKSRVFW